MTTKLYKMSKTYLGRPLRPTGFEPLSSSLIIAKLTKKTKESKRKKLHQNQRINKHKENKYIQQQQQQQQRKQKEKNQQEQNQHLPRAAAIMRAVHLDK